MRKQFYLADLNVLESYNAMNKFKQNHDSLPPYSIGTAFVWTESNEGHSYWAKLDELAYDFRYTGPRIIISIKY